MMSNINILIGNKLLKAYRNILQHKPQVIDLSETLSNYTSVFKDGNSSFGAHSLVEIKDAIHSYDYVSVRDRFAIEDELFYQQVILEAKRHLEESAQLHDILNAYLTGVLLDEDDLAYLSVQEAIAEYHSSVQKRASLIRRWKRVYYSRHPKYASSRRISIRKSLCTVRLKKISKNSIDEDDNTAVVSEMKKLTVNVIFNTINHGSKNQGLSLRKNERGNHQSRTKALQARARQPLYC